jgi:hypothetical protein
MNITTLLASLAVLSILCSHLHAIEISVNGPDGKPIVGAEAAIILKSGAYQKGKPQGSSITFEPFDGQARIYLAAPGFEGDSRSFTPVEKAAFILKPSTGRNSIIIYGRGALPDKGGDINPILDTQNRTYIYGLGIGLFDGSKPANQPLTFRLKSPIQAEDSTGNRFKIYVIDISQTISLVEYTK